MNTRLPIDTLIVGISELVTARGAGRRHGGSMSRLFRLTDAAIAIAGGRFAWIGRERDRPDHPGQVEQVIDLGGRAVTPGLVDPHTHSVWAGDRLADFERRTHGVEYEQLQAAGGGIRSTVAATGAATVAELVELALPRIHALMASGASVIEIKSGYGFTPKAEVAMLEAVQLLAQRVPARLLPTLLIHIPPAAPRDRSAYRARVVEELIPEVARRGLATAVDVFVEREAWRVDEAEGMLLAARRHGLQLKLHAAQFSNVGGVELAARLGALSVDHLEAAAAPQIATIAGCAVAATLLPGVSLHLGIPAAPGRALIDAGAAVAVGTDLNPGSSPLYSTALALALAVRLNGLTAQEALIAGTLNAACALGRDDAGRIETGQPADFLVLQGQDWRELVYTLGANPVQQVWIGGRPCVAEQRA